MESTIGIAEAGENGNPHSWVASNVRRIVLLDSTENEILHKAEQQCLSCRIAGRL